MAIGRNGVTALLLKNAAGRVSTVMFFRGLHRSSELKARSFQ